MSKVTEEKARQMPAGTELDRICAEWMGWELLSVEGDNEIWHHRGQNDTRVRGELPPFSADWSAAGPLLEAIERALPSASLTRDSTLGVGWVCWLRVTLPPGGSQLYVGAPTPQLAIARACAVLVALGITMNDLNQPTP